MIQIRIYRHTTGPDSPEGLPGLFLVDYRHTRLRYSLGDTPFPLAGSAQPAELFHQQAQEKLADEQQHREQTDADLRDEPGVAIDCDVIFPAGSDSVLFILA